MDSKKDFFLINKKDCIQTPTELSDHWDCLEKSCTWNAVDVDIKIIIKNRLLQ